MRLEVSIPDQLYSQAQNMASDIGVSLDHFVSEAMQLRIEDEPQQTLSLTPDQIVKIRKSQEEIRAGKGMTMAQVEESLATRRAAWLQKNPH